MFWLGFLCWEEGGWKGAGRESHNPATQQVAGLVLRNSNYMKGCCERQLQAAISSNFYLSGNKKRLDCILSTGEAEMSTEVLRPLLVSCFRRLSQGRDAQLIWKLRATEKTTGYKKCEKIPKTQTKKPKPQQQPTRENKQKTPYPNLEG